MAKGDAKNFTENMIQLFIAEFVGTAMLLLFGCLGCVAEVAGVPMSHHMTCLTFGLAVMIPIQCFGHLSGGHLNPCVTIAAVILGNLKPLVALIYVIAQFSGATLGFGVLKLLIPSEYVATEVFSHETNMTVMRLGLCSTVPNPKLSAMQAVGIETIITGVLILVCCAIWDKRNSKNMDSVSLKFGFVIAGLAMATAPFTGSSMNPARSFAPAMLNGDWAGHWIYWVGPISGASGAALFYKFLYSAPAETAHEEELHQLDEIGDNGVEKR